MKKLTLSKIVNAVVGLVQKTGGEVEGEKTVSPKIADISRRLSAEGIVMLKNDGTLPVKDETISVFGRVQNDYFYVGYGSGGDVKAPYKVNLMQGLKSNGVSVNQRLADIYDEWCKRNEPDEGFWGHWPLNFPEMKVTDLLVEQAAKVSNVALFVVGRAAGEDREQRLVKGGYYVSDREKEIARLITKRFKNTVLVLDVGNIMDLSWTEEFDFSSILYVWQGGMESGNAIADVISGKVNPSGKLPDTIARNYQDYPTAHNFGTKNFCEYAEDIYVGYRYFSTFDRDSVLYPFGFGLSYTQFETECKILRLGEHGLRIEMQVKNVGECAGKDVVQLYLNPPNGLLGKPCRNLIAFKKTALLEIGATENMTFDIPLSALASYDDYGYTGHKDAYVLEAGEYQVFVGDSLNNRKIGEFAVAKTEVLKQCEEVCAVRPCDGFDVLHPVQVDGKITKEYSPVATANVDLKERILTRLPSANLQESEVKPSFYDVKDGIVSLDEFVASLSPQELEMLTHGHYRMNSPLGAKGNAGAFGGISKSLQAVGVPVAVTTDGPSGVRLACYASLLPCGTAIAASFNENLAYDLYFEIANELKEKGSDVLLAPGMNIHRDPLCGRNFEYYSEDPLLTGKLAAAVVRGLQDGGVSACPKHFACNNQETNRSHHDSRVSQRALREIYLKGFEICIKEAKPLMIMASYNRLNGEYNSYNYDLFTSILRGEFGFEGCVTTDWWTVPERDKRFKNIYNNAYRVRAQVDVVMPGGDRVAGKYDDSACECLARHDGLTIGELQRSARNVLRFLLKNPSTAKKIKREE